MLVVAGGLTQTPEIGWTQTDTTEVLRSPSATKWEFVGKLPIPMRYVQMSLINNDFILSGGYGTGYGGGRDGEFYLLKLYFKFFYWITAIP